MLELYRRHGSKTGRFRTSMKKPAISFGSTPKCQCERLTGHRPSPTIRLDFRIRRSPVLTRRPHILKSKECKSASRPVLRSTEVRRVFLSIEHRSSMDGKERACTIVRSLENFKEALQSHHRLFRLVCTLVSRTLARLSRAKS